MKIFLTIIIITGVLFAIFYVFHREVIFQPEADNLKITNGVGDDFTDHLKLQEKHVSTLDGRIYQQASEIVDPTGFINTESITLAQARKEHKLVLLHFWTYGCINCQRTLGHLNEWYEKYYEDGLEIIGVHYPEFSYVRKRVNVEEFVNKNNILYPVVLDNDAGTWRAYNNRYWPHRYLISSDGAIIFDHIGEGAYEETEQKIRDVLYNR